MAAALRHPLLLILLLLAAFGLQLAWKDRSLRVERLRLAESSSLKIQQPQLDWLQQSLGQRATHAATAPLDWAAQQPTGLELLEEKSPRAAAAQRELERWGELGDLGLDIHSWGLRAATAADGSAVPAVVLDLVCLGDQATVLAWLSHLLAAETDSGYLTDVARIHLREVADQRLQLDLALRVWPAEAFIAPAGASS